MKHFAARSLITAAALLIALPLIAAGTFTVTTVNDSGPGSLRQAIVDATTAKGGTIVFAIGNGAQTIKLLSPLPEARKITIDGRTQPGFIETPLIELDGSLMPGAPFGSFDDALTMTAGAVYSLVINRAPDAGIRAQTTTVSGCYIGLDRTGKIARPNGIGISGSGLFEKNVISGNQTGIDADGGTIRDNFLGTNASGTAVLPVQPYGTSYHILIDGFWSSPGNVAISKNVIGGGSYGIHVRAPGRVTASQNYIGITPNGTALPLNIGVEINSSTDSLLFRNTIAHCHGPAVKINSRTSLKNLLTSNRIHSNGFGIDLDDGSFPSAQTPNDADDGDVGPNNLINFPELTRATVGASGTTVTGTLKSHPNSTFTIELFVTPSCHASGYGQGASPFLSFEATTGADGIATFTQTIPKKLTAGQVVTATTSSSDEGTSEFSRCTMIEGPGIFELGAAAYSQHENEKYLLFEVHRRAGAIGAASVQLATADGTALAGSDYNARSGRLDFADGETSKLLKVAILDDNVYEGHQAFTLTLSAATGATLGSPSTATMTIADDEQRPQVMSSYTNVQEGHSGTTPLTFPVTLNRPAEMPIHVHYETSGQTAEPGTDYTETSGTLTFAPGQTQQTVVVAVTGDQVPEQDEGFRITFSNGEFQSAVTGGILNDDGPITVTANDVTLRETDGTQTAIVTLIVPQGVSGYIYYSTVNGTARSGEDFTPRVRYVYLDGAPTHHIEIPILGDDLTEDTEHFELRLEPESGDFAIDDRVVITILDDDIGVGPEKVSIPVGETRRGVINIGGAFDTDTTFTLLSSGPDAVAVPASVILPMGQTRVEFDIRALIPGRRETVTVTFPAAIGGGERTIRVWTHTPGELTLSPAELTLYPGQVVTVNASFAPGGTELSIPLSGSDTVEVPERLVIDASGHGSFTVKALKNGPLVITAMLPAAFGSDEVRVLGQVAEPPSIPTLTGVTPNNGSTAGGTRVDVRGALFRTDCTLAFGGVPATLLQYVDASTFNAIAPPHEPGTVDLTLTCGEDVASLSRAFTYRGAGPQLSAIAPSSGNTGGGTYVRISGHDFASSCWPFFDGVASPEALVRDPHTITAMVPPHAAGTVDVRLLCTGSDALLAGAFTFTTALDPAAQIARIVPSFGAPGDVVTVEGTGFRPGDIVSFETIRAVVLDSTPESHTVVVPNVAPGQASVTIGAGSNVLSTSGPVFTVGEASPPRVSRVVPAIAAAGAELVLEGTSMRAPYTFAIEGLPMPLVSLLPTRAVVRLPADLPAGTYPVAVMNASNQIASLGPAVNVRAEGVVVTSVAANCGATDGGVDVVITGSGFAAGAAVRFDNVPATNITVIDGTTIQARVPSNYAGTATIAVTNPDGSGSTLTDAFRYSSPFDPQRCAGSNPRTRSVRH